MQGESWGGLCTLWNLDIFQMESNFESTHWIMVRFVHLHLGMIIHLLNVYMPNNYWDKIECWNTLLEIKELGFRKNCIIVGDFNTTLHQKEKIGGSIVRDSFREKWRILYPLCTGLISNPIKGNTRGIIKELVWATSLLNLIDFWFTSPFYHILGGYPLLSFLGHVLITAPSP